MSQLNGTVIVAFDPVMLICAVLGVIVKPVGCEGSVNAEPFAPNNVIVELPKVKVRVLVVLLVKVVADTVCELVSSVPAKI